jgi:hypothetical protein
LCCARLAAQWKHIPGPDGGLVINLDTDGNLLCALTRRDIYHSDDEGGGIYHMALPPVQSDAATKPSFKCSPTHDGHLHLEADVFFMEEIPLEVLDVAGRRVATKTLSPGQAWDLDFPNLPQILYLLML